MRQVLFLTFLLLAASCGDEKPQNASGSGAPAATAADVGKALFQQNCATCHMLDRDMTGPQLGDVLSRWNNDRAKLKAFIRNPEAMIGSGDPLAVAADKRGNGSMPAFGHVSDESLDQIISYIQSGR